MVLLLPADGELARYTSRSAPSSFVFGVRDQEMFCFCNRRSGGGVRGGDDAIRVAGLRRKLCTGRSASSSSLNSGDGGSSGTVDASEMKERLWMLFDAKCACLVCLIGDDSGRS